MGSHRKKKSNGGSVRPGPPPLLDETAVSSTSSASTDATTSHSNNHNNTNNHQNRRASSYIKRMQPVESGGSECSTVVDAVKNTTSNNSNNRPSNSTDWSHDFAKAMQEIEGTSKAFRVSWKEMFAFVLVLVVLAGISILVGIAAGISISVHYYETPENVDLRMLNHPAAPGGANIMDTVSPHRVTILDPAIASSNRLYPFHGGGDELRRVVHTSTTTGQKSLLPIVEESPMGIPVSKLNADGSAESTAPLLPSRPRYPILILDEWLREPPKLCADKSTMGYDTWVSLRSAVRDINRYSANRFDRWYDYFKTVEEMLASPDLYHDTATLSLSSFSDDRMYYEEPIVVTICPGVVLKPARRSPIFVNTESVTIECEGCQVVGGSTHLSFGPAAQNTVIRGITFRLAGSSSLLFHHDGAEVTFEDCTWIVRDKKKSSLGKIAEVNSTSSISFSRCVASEADGRLSEMTTSLRNANDVLRYASVKYGNPYL